MFDLATPHFNSNAFQLELAKTSSNAFKSTADEQAQQNQVSSQTLVVQIVTVSFTSHFFYFHLVNCDVYSTFSQVYLRLAFQQQKRKKKQISHKSHTMI